MLRSKAFWLGVPGLVFLGWAWVDSFWHMAAAGFYHPGMLQVGSRLGVLFAWNEPGAGVNWGSPMASYRRIPEGFDAAAALREEPGFDVYTVPYAMVILVYLLAWAGLLVWRARGYRAVGSDAPADRSGP